MADLIDRVTLMADIDASVVFSGGKSWKAEIHGANKIIGRIKAAPTVDAVEVVRCKDCKHYEIHKPKVLENCERNGYIIPMKPDDFCSYGERKDGDGND